MEWSDKYSIGIVIIDKQHKELFEIINKFKDSFTDKKVNSTFEVGKVLRYLVGYTSFHFATEEDYLTRIGYTKLDEHKVIHVKFVKELHDILLKLKTTGFYTPIQLYYFLNKWLQEHILVEDQKYASFKGQLKPMKSKLDNKEDLIPIIQVNLSNLERMLKDSSINSNERKLKRLDYLQAYLVGYEMDNVHDLYKMLRALSLLSSKNIITRTEDLDVKKYLVSIVDIQKIMQACDSPETKEEFQNYLEHNKLI